MSLDNYKSLTPEHREKIIKWAEKFEHFNPTLIIIDKVPPRQLGVIVSPNDTTERDYIHNVVGTIIKMGNINDLPEDDSAFTDSVSLYNAGQKKRLMSKYSVGDKVVFHVATPQRILHPDLPPSGVWVMDICDVYGKYNG